MVKPFFSVYLVTANGIKMKALTFQGKKTIEYSSIEDPVLIDEGDVILKVLVSSICGSDLHLYHQYEPQDIGTAMGHEFIGEVMAKGKAVRHLKTGDIVICPFTTSCGSCYYCSVGLTCRCVKSQLFGWRSNGHGLHGGQAEFIRVPLAESTLKKIPEGISLQEGILLGDVMSTGFYCALQANIKPDEIYAVVGCGPVGLMAVLGAKEYGAEVVFAIDTVEDRLEIARSYGAIALNPLTQDISSIVSDATSGKGAAAVMEAVGKSSSMNTAYDLVRPGGIISSVGVCNDKNFSISPTQAYDKNLTLKVGRCPARYMMDQLTPIVQKKKYKVDSIISHNFPMSSGALAYQIFDEKRDGSIKVLLKP
ncbi:MAG TPA: alcohol dehydrogenase catalytic domain-containing protein [Chitinophagaceae bacterium]